MKGRFLEIFLLVLQFNNSSQVLDVVVEHFFHDSHTICFLTTNLYDKRIFRNQVFRVFELVELKKSDCQICPNVVIFFKNYDFFNQLRLHLCALEGTKMCVILPAVFNTAENIRKIHRLCIENYWSGMIIFINDLTDLPGKFNLQNNKSEEHEVLFSCLTNNTITSKSEKQLLKFLKDHSEWNFLKILNSLNRTLKISTFHLPPYSIVENGEASTGIEVNLLKLIVPTPLLNFKIASKDDLSGDENLFYFVEGELAKKNGSDIGLASLWVRLEAISIYDHVYPYAQQCMTFVVPKSTIASETMILFHSFNWKLWISIFSMMLFWTFAARFPPIENFKESSFFLIILQLFALNGIPNLSFTRHNFIRYLLLVWSLFCIISASMYSAGLTKSLSYPPLTRDINTFEKMITYKIRWIDEFNGPDFYSTSSNDSLADISRLYLPIEEKTREKFENTGYRVVFLPGGYIANLDNIDGSTLRQLRIIPACLENAHIAFGIQKKSPFKNFLDGKILQLLQHGFVEYWFHRFALNENRESLSQLMNPYPEDLDTILNFRKMAGLFVFFAIAMFLSFVVFIWEFMNPHLNHHFIS